MIKHSITILSLAIALCYSTAVYGATDGLAAKVNNEVILKSELDTAINHLKAERSSITDEMAYSQALEGLIAKKLQLDIIKKAGIAPDEELVTQELMRIAQNQGYSSLTAFQQAIEKQSTGSFSNLRQQVVDELAIAGLWQHELGNRVRISEKQIQEFLASPQGQALQSDEYRTIHVRIPYLDDYNRLSEQQKQEAMATALRLKNLLEQGISLQMAMQSARGNYPRELQGADTGYNQVATLPAAIVSKIITLPIGKATDPIITDHGIDVVLLADKRVTQVIEPQWHTGHILAKIDATQSEAIARQKIDDIHKALQQGADFQTLATRYSDDKGSATKGGDLGWVQEGQMVPEFQAVMQNTTKGNFSDPFVSRFGYHILKVNDLRQQDVTDERRHAQAQQILFQQLASQALEDWIQEMRAGAYIEMVK